MSTNHSPMIALFPGQGAQFVGMGKDLFENFGLARECFEEASEAIKLDLRKLCFEGPESDLVKTANTQPALLTVSVAAFRVAQKELGFRPIAAAGHSLGEYSALVAAGAFSLGTAAAWVHERGAAMQKAVPAGEGTMAAILGVDDAQVEALCAKATEVASARRKEGAFADLTVAPTCEPANYNAPGQLVIAGSTDGIETAIELAKSGEFGKAKAMPLSVSAPFHCSLMGPARNRMAELFSSAPASSRPTKLDFAYIPNRTARLAQEPGLIFELLVDQVDHAVLWKQSVQAFLAANHTQAVEFGPGKVLQGLAKRITSSDGRTLSVLSCGESSALAPLETALKGTGGSV